MAVNHSNELREALQLPANDTPEEYWEAVVECLREWGASNRDFRKYEWERNVYMHARARIQKRFQAESSRDLDIRASSIASFLVHHLHDVFDAHGRDWILQRLRPPPSRSVQGWIVQRLFGQASGVSTQQATGSPKKKKKTSITRSYSAWLLLAIGVVFSYSFNSLCTDHRKPFLRSTCAPLTKEGAAFRHNVTREFSIAQALIPTLSHQVMVNGALDNSEENGFRSAASSIQQASKSVEKAIDAYTSCLHDFTNEKVDSDNWKDSTAPPPNDQRDGLSGWLRNKTCARRAPQNQGLIPTALSYQIGAFTHKASLTTTAGAKLRMSLDRLMMAIQALRALVHAVRMQNSISGNTNGGGAADQTTALLNALDHLGRSAKRCRYFLSRIQAPAKNASAVTTQAFEHAVKARLGSAGPLAATRRDVISREVDALDEVRRDARLVARDWALLLTMRDDFLFEGEEEERMWNAMQPAAGEWVLKG
ncbi:MAG: hypothetical protein Q9216_006329 [Gyalolechia sp. 2 TL-2023]